MSYRPFHDKAVEAAFAAYPDKLRYCLMDLRELIFQTAAETDDTGSLVECLKWGQPAYLTERPKSGSTIRLGTFKAQDPRYALYVHCQSGLIGLFRDHYDGLFLFEGNRAVVFVPDNPVPLEPLKHCIGMALTYHLRNRSRRSKAAV